MSDKDAISKEFMQNPVIFADLFNFKIYGGRQVIKPENLTPLDTTAIAIPYGSDGKPFPIQKYRDLLKQVCIKYDDRATYVVLGVENQSQVHYAMPPRTMFYDAVQYLNQIATAERLKGELPTGAGFLSGFGRKDKIFPVATATVYYGTDEWTGPRSLFEMFGDYDPELLQFVQDYKLNLIVPSEIEEEDFPKLHSDLNPLFRFLKHTGSASRLVADFSSDSAFRFVDKTTVDMINVFTDANIPYSQNEERVDMCQAILDIKAHAKTEGFEEGFGEGVLKTLTALVSKGLLTVREAAEEAKMTVAEFCAKSGLTDRD